MNYTRERKNNIIFRDNFILKFILKLFSYTLAHKLRRNKKLGPDITKATMWWKINYGQIIIKKNFSEKGLRMKRESFFWGKSNNNVKKKMVENANIDEERARWLVSKGEKGNHYEGEIYTRT